MFLICRLAIPLHSLMHVLRHAFAIRIAPTQSILRWSMTLLRRLAIPLHRFCYILCHTCAIRIALTQIVLGLRIPLLCLF